MTTDRKRRAAEVIKEIYEAIRGGNVVNIEYKTDDDGDGSVTRLFISGPNKERVRILLAKGSMRDWY